MPLTREAREELAKAIQQVRQDKFDRHVRDTLGGQPPRSRVDRGALQGVIDPSDPADPNQPSTGGPQAPPPKQTSDPATPPADPPKKRSRWWPDTDG